MNIFIFIMINFVMVKMVGFLTMMYLSAYQIMALRPLAQLFLLNIKYFLINISLLLICQQVNQKYLLFFISHLFLIQNHQYPKAKLVSLKFHHL